MNVLALETTEALGSVAAWRDGNLLTQLRLMEGQRSAGSLVPALRELRAAAGWRTRDIGLVAACIGPGSFTGLRVGVTAAKTLAYCAGAEVLGLDTLQVIAVGCPQSAERLGIAVDAQRGQVAAGLFRRDEQGWPIAQADWQVLDLDAWLGSFPRGTAIAGPILRRAIDRVPPGVEVLDSAFWAPTAAAAARLAEHLYAAGQRDDLWKLAPRYSRKPAAVEKWEASRKLPKS